MALVQDTSLPTEEQKELVALRERVEFLKDQLDEAHFRIAGLDEDIADKRREIGRLERQLARQEKEGVEQGAAERVFDRWVNALGKNSKRTVLTPDRRKAINTAIKQRTEALCNKIVDQGAKTPFLVYGNFKASGSPDSRRDDIADWLGKGKYAEQLLELADATPAINWTEAKVAEAHSLLLSTEAVLDRLQEGKGWTAATFEILGVGLAEGRLIFPVRDEDGTLTAVTKYHPRLRPADKNVVKSYADGKRGMFPAPETVDSEVIWLVEGEADAVTAHEMWLPGVALPGASVTPGDWMKRLKDKRVVICLDCDNAGRKCANRIARPLTQYAVDVRVVDLDPTRSDGFDLTDWFHQGRQKKTLEEMARQAKPVSRVQTPSLLPQQATGDDHDALFNDFVRALEQRDCDPKELRGGQWIARCPHHDDRVPTLHFKRGARTPVVADCKAGCEWPAIKETLAWPARGAAHGVR